MRLRRCCAVCWHVAGRGGLPDARNLATGDGERDTELHCHDLVAVSSSYRARHLRACSERRSAPATCLTGLPDRTSAEPLGCGCGCGGRCICARSAWAATAAAPRRCAGMGASSDTLAGLPYRRASASKAWVPLCAEAGRPPSLCVHPRLSSDIIKPAAGVRIAWLYADTWVPAPAGWQELTTRRNRQLRRSRTNFLKATAP
jgi:hypothetical protein